MKKHIVPSSDTESEIASLKHVSSTYWNNQELHFILRMKTVKEKFRGCSEKSVWKQLHKK